MNMDPRITVKTNLDGQEYLAIDGRGMFAAFSLRPFGSKTYRLCAVLRANRIVFTGSPTGEHSIEADEHISSAERIEAHWRGYVENATRAIFRN